MVTEFTDFYHIMPNLAIGVIVRSFYLWVKHHTHITFTYECNTITKSVCVCVRLYSHFNGNSLCKVYYSTMFDVQSPYNQTSHTTELYHTKDLISQNDHLIHPKLL